jgi:hypothetical protein
MKNSKRSRHPDIKPVRALDRAELSEANAGTRPTIIAFDTGGGNGGYESEQHNETLVRDRRHRSRRRTRRARTRQARSQ